MIELVDLQGIFSEKQLDLVDELTPLNIQARYPVYKEAIPRLFSEDKAKDVLERTEEFLKWLKARIK